MHTWVVLHYLTLSNSRSGERGALSLYALQMTCHDYKHRPPTLNNIIYLSFYHWKLYVSYLGYVYVQITRLLLTKYN